MRLLDLESGQTRSLAGGHESPVYRLRFTPDGRTLVTSGEIGDLYRWDVGRGAVAERLSGHTGQIDGLDIAVDGRTLFTASADTRAILWDLAGDRRLDRRFTVEPRFDSFATPRGIAVSPDGRTLAFTHSDGTVDLLDTRTLEPRARVRATDGPALAVDFSPDGRLLAVTGENRACHVVGCTLSCSRGRAPRDEPAVPGIGVLTRRQAPRRCPDPGRARAASDAGVGRPTPARSRPSALARAQTRSRSVPTAS